MAALDDYAPFDAGIGAARTEDWFRKHFRHLTGSGVISGVTNEFAVTQHGGGDQTVDVATGECFLRGHWGESTSTKNIALSTAHATLARIDRVVLRVDFALNTISIEVLEGTPGASPAPPALTQDTTKWEVGLARIARAANDNVIGTADITDERNFLTFAGIEGLPVKRAVRAASITNVTLASACEVGDTFGGVTLAYGDRIGLFGQTTASENGVYTVNQTGAPTRATDANTSAKMRPNTLVPVSEGTLADKWYQLTTNAPIVLGTTDLVWAEFGSRGLTTAKATRTSGDITLSSASVANVDTGLDLPLPGVVVGDVIGVGMNGKMSNQNVDTWFDVATVVAGSPVNYFSSGSGTPAAFGLQGWYCSGLVYSQLGSEARYTVQAGDVSGGTVVLRLRYKQTTATSRDLRANAGEPFRWHATNYGQ